MEDGQSAREAHKICGVCGDRALGYNFNAVSCESCKAFFRRNAIKNKDFRCPFTENCTITPVTRRFCQKCRLDKCFSIGMRKEYIMSEEDKVLKRQKIEQNRAKKRPKSDSPKAAKTKKGSMDDCNFDDASISVNSVASTISETYFWESDRKYADLDGNRSHVMDNMSPVTAASVPSPLSPSENTDIGGSKTLEMLKETPQSAAPIFGKHEQHCSFNENHRDTSRRRISTDSLTNSVAKYDEFSEPLENDENDKSPVAGKKKMYRTVSELDCGLNSGRNCSATYDIEPEVHTSPYRVCGQSITCSLSYQSYQEDKPDEKRSTMCDLNVTSQSNMQMDIEGTTICQKPKEICSTRPDLSSKFAKNPDFVTKLLNNPNLIAKIINDEDVLKRILMDPEVITKLSADPQVSEFFEETNDDSEQQGDLNNTTADRCKEDPDNNSISENPKHVHKQRHVDNPILTDLITNRNSEECRAKHSEMTMYADMNKTMTDVTRDVLQEVQRIPIAANSIESILCEAIKLEFSAYSALSGSQTSRELNDAERAKLNELIVANKSLLAPLDDDITNLIGEECKFRSNFGQSDPMLLDVINLTAIAIRRLIKMSKKINAFKNMCQEDQLALLKGGCTEMLILRSALNYDPDKDMWKIPHSQERMSNIKVDVLKEAKGNLYAEHARFVRTFDPRWRDENIILILSAITLFSPDRPRVVHSDVIKLEQNSYYYLLRRYLESVYPGCEAKSTFLKLIQKISELHRLNDEVVGVYLNVNPSSVEPLLIEIFDLKH